MRSTGLVSRGPHRRRWGRTRDTDRVAVRAGPAPSPPYHPRSLGRMPDDPYDLRVLILGGTTEARRLADVLAAEAPHVHVTSSLAGRVTDPSAPAGDIRVGGFGGPDALAAWLLAHRIDVLVDATHPFAATISAHAVQAAAACGTEHFALRRPGWPADPRDRRHPARSSRRPPRCSRPSARAESSSPPAARASPPSRVPSWTGCTSSYAPWNRPSHPCPAAHTSCSTGAPTPSKARPRSCWHTASTSSSPRTAADPPPPRNSPPPANSASPW